MKIIGGLFILLSSIISSYAYEKSLKQEISRLSEIEKFLTHIKVQIEYFSSSLPDIYSSFGEKTDYILSAIENKSVSGVPKDIKDKINHCLNTLGSGYKKEQLAILNLTVEEVNRTLNYVKENLPNKLKATRATSLFVGLSIVILLI